MMLKLNVIAICLILFSITNGLHLIKDGSATIKDYPYLASVESYLKIKNIFEGYNQIAIGVLITSKHVLANGFCYPYAKNSQKLQIRAGTASTNTSVGEIRSVQEVYYSNKSITDNTQGIYDLTVFVTTKKFISNVYPVKLPKENFIPSYDETFSAVGWFNFDFQEVAMKLDQNCNSPNKDAVFCAYSVNSFVFWGTLSHPLVDPTQGVLLGISAEGNFYLNITYFYDFLNPFFLD